MRNGDKIDLGSVQVHKKVFAEIVLSALDGIEGVSLLQKSFGGSLSEIFGKKEFPGIQISVDEAQDVTLELKVLVRYGMNIPDAARHVQEVVRSAVKKILDVNLKNININVQGLERGGK